jgi:putative IMPACT (imprinted ancient) family translation regulator
LGKSGLINAYKSAAKDTLSNAEIVKKVIKESISIDFHYEGMNDIMNIMQRQDFEIVNQVYDSKCSITCQIPKSKISQVIKTLKAYKAVIKVTELPG